MKFGFRVNESVVEVTIASIKPADLLVMQLRVNELFGKYSGIAHEERWEPASPPYPFTVGVYRLYRPRDADKFVRGITRGMVAIGGERDDSLGVIDD